MKLRNKLITLILIPILVVSCTSVPPLDFIVADVGPIENRKDASLLSVTAGYAPQSKQRKMECNNYDVPRIFKEGLQDAINRSLAFKDDAVKKVNLSVRILTCDMPAFGAAMTTKFAAIYEIVDRENGDLLFSETVSSEGVVPMDYAFVGLVRAQESVNRAARNNIADFINTLNDADISNPIFKGNN